MDPLSNLMKIVKAALNDEIPESVLRTHVGKLQLSTMETIDMGWETAIRYNGNWYPVQRYDTQPNAEIGHYKWCEKAKTLKEIPILGCELYSASDKVIPILIT